MKCHCGNKHTVCCNLKGQTEIAKAMKHWENGLSESNILKTIMCDCGRDELMNQSDQSVVEIEINNWSLLPMYQWFIIDIIMVKLYYALTWCNA